jgi:hypothetical protein
MFREFAKEVGGPPTVMPAIRDTALERISLWLMRGIG